MYTIPPVPSAVVVLAVASTVAVGLAWLAAQVWRRKSAALRHLFWLLALAAPLAALPLLWVHARIAVPILPATAAEFHELDFSAENWRDLPLSSTGDGGSVATSSASSPDWLHQSGSHILSFNLWATAWLIGGGLILLRLLFSHLRVRRLVRVSCSPGPERLALCLDRIRRHFQSTRPVRLMITPLTEIPFCHGIFRPTVVFPESWEEWDEERIEVCMTHEMAHVVRGDLFAMLIGQLACTLCWFNPLIWMAAGRLRDEAENAADDRVLARNIQPETYAANLVAITERYRAPALSPTIALSMARPNRLKSRVEAILDATILRKTPGTRVVFVTVLLAAFALVAGMTLRLTAATVSTASDQVPPLAPNTAAATSSNPTPGDAQKKLNDALLGAIHQPVVEFAGVGKTLQENLAEVERLLQQGADPKAKDKSGNSALIYALNFGLDDVACALIEHGADGNVGDGVNENAAWLAASLFYCPKALELLIQKGVKVTGVDKQGENILHHLTRTSALNRSHTSFFGGVPYSEERQKAYEARERRTVDLLVAAGVDINAKDHSDGADGARTPLMAVLRGQHFVAARALIDNGADLSLTDAGENTALAYLFNWSGFAPLPVDIVESMLAHGVDPNGTVRPLGGEARDAVPAMEQALTICPNHTSEEIASLRKVTDLFLGRGAVFSQVTDEKVQALLKAAAQGDLKSVQDLVQQGTPINSSDGHGWSALTLSVALGYTDVAQWLLAQGADPALPASQRHSALFLAAKGGQADLVDTLVDKGPKPNPDATRGINFAVVLRNQPIFDALIKAGADPKAISLFACIQAGQAAMAETALDAGVNPDQIEGSGSLVYWAVNYHQPEILKALLDHGANPLIGESYRKITPLELAQKAHPDLVPMLEEAIKRAPAVPASTSTQAVPGAVLVMTGSVSTPSMFGQSNLDEIRGAIGSGDSAGVKALLDKGSSFGPLDMQEALRDGRQPIVRLLWEHGTPRYCSELTYAINQDQPLEKIKGLVEAGAALNPVEYCLVTPLGMAAQRGNLAVAQLLISRGAEVYPKDGDLNPLDQAVGVGKQLEMVDFLLKSGAKITNRTVMQTILWGTAAGPSPNEISTKIMARLIEAGALKGIPEDEVASLLVLAFQKQNPAILRLLLDAGLSPFSRTRQGPSVLAAVRALKAEPNPYSDDLEPLLQMMERAARNPEAPASVGAQSIVFDHLKFDKLELGKVLQILSDKSKGSDPKARGVHFVLRLTFAKEGTMDPRIHPEVTLDATSITLGDVLDQISVQTGLKYEVEFAGARLVYLWPPVEEGSTVMERTYSVPPNIITGQYSQAASIPGTAPAPEKGPRQIDVKRELTNRGLVFGDGSSATFMPTTDSPILGGKLVMRNTITQLDLLSLLLDHASLDDRLAVEIRN